MKLTDKGKEKKEDLNNKKKNKNSKNQKKKSNKIKQKINVKLIEENDEEKLEDLKKDEETIEIVKDHQSVNETEKEIKENNSTNETNTNGGIGEGWKIINKKDKSKKKDEMMPKKEEKEKINKGKEKVYNFPLEYAWNNHKKINYNKYLNEGMNENRKGKTIEINKEKEKDKGNKTENKNEIAENTKNPGLNDSRNKNILENLIFSNFNEFSPKIFLEEDALIEEYKSYILDNNDYKKIIPALNIGIFVVELNNRLKYQLGFKEKKNKKLTGYLGLSL
ncbi:unnamed protein product [Meloidogyne enterolobii]|uniref:Uncharacterized protein n=1 Tax=Meloidogyne enterolobii TaxID=390850 RepID=A0ACB0ZAM7_MELEN